MSVLIASVAIKRPISKLYDYIIPTTLLGKILSGSIVYVPIRNQISRGCVVSIKKAEENDGKGLKLKEIINVITPDYQISEKLINLGNWMIDYYLSYPGFTFSCISFIGFNKIASKTESIVCLKSPEFFEKFFDLDNDNKTDDNKIKLTSREKYIIQWFLDNENSAFTKTEIHEETGVSLSMINKLITKGILEIYKETLYRNDPYYLSVEKSLPIKLNSSQQTAFSKIDDAISSDKSETFLLYGVTGSGKTEVYLQAIDKCLKMNKQSIILISEISLTPQTVERFRARFGDIVGVYHSKLSIGQKYDLYKKIVSKEILIVVGARSALFTPFDNLGLIIVDEEHERTFKQDTDPRYQSRDVAVMRGYLEKAVVILGSATPSLESYHNTQIGKYTLLKLPERVENIPMPPVTLVDMSRNIMESASSDILSPELTYEISNTLNRKEQIILFINRRGFFNFFNCLKCRTMIKCSQCDLTLTYHKIGNKMLCHLCGKKYNVPKICPSCGSDNIIMIGAGIQRVEEEIKEKFPDARLLRVDLDTTTSKNAFIENWKKIVNNEADIILGTQMIAKGFHLENVTLVGVVMADIGLHLPDFRATERTFSLLMQVAGRAGRGLREGKVIIQTYHPEHYAFNWAKEHNYDSFAQKELKIRSILQFPPHSKLFAIIISSLESDQARFFAEKTASTFRDIIYKHQEKGISVIGPAPSPISKVKGHYRWRILLRAKSHKIIKKYIPLYENEFEKWKNKSKVQIIFDVDPFDLL